MSENRYLITRIKKRNTLSGKPVVDLYAGGKDSKLRFPVLTLFDLSELAVVEIDPNDLNGQEVNCRFWAYYTESGKLNKDGNPYRDIDHLEVIAAPVTPAESANVEAVMEALDRVYDELAGVREALGTLRAELAAVYNLLTRQSQTDDPAPQMPATVIATATDYWTLARGLSSVDQEIKRRLAVEAARTGDWAGAMARLSS
ncbi:MAG: hypothetical protein JW934_19025 [Anaerolineae bacterium]|nr:hypothetical protein [Anaerolineae bacterium]